MKLPSLRPNRRSVLAAAVAVAVVTVDTVSKQVVRDTLALGERRQAVDDVLVLTHIQNTGAAYGLFAGQRWLLVITAAVIAAATPLLLRALPLTGRWAWAGPVLTGMIVGGAAGNLIERARHGYVTDFLQTPPIELFQVFNASDVSISVAIVTLLVLSFVVRDEPPRPVPAGEAGPAGAGEAVPSADAGETDEPAPDVAPPERTGVAPAPSAESETGNAESAPVAPAAVAPSTHEGDIDTEAAPAESGFGTDEPAPAAPSDDASTPATQQADAGGVLTAVEGRMDGKVEDRPKEHGTLKAARPEDGEDGAAHAAGKSRD